MSTQNPRLKLSKDWFNRGNALNNLKRHDEALVSYKQAVTLNPSFVDAWFNYGATLDELKHYDEALVSFERALALKPDLRGSLE